jgi:hypothetical protein
MDDFGIGWRLDLHSMTLTENGIQGSGWDFDLNDP